jgi:1-acyl-sn-glycerol-3-phosphate acyltransferase
LLALQVLSCGVASALQAKRAVQPVRTMVAIVLFTCLPPREICWGGPVREVSKEPAQESPERPRESRLLPLKRPRGCDCFDFSAERPTSADSGRKNPCRTLTD